MIAADHFLLDGDIAWLATDRLIVPGVADWVLFDRPCETCDTDDEVWHEPTCIDGRYTFDIEVECPNIECGDVRVGPCSKCENRNAPRRRTTYRVSIVPGMALEIASGHDAEYRPMIWMSSEGVFWLMAAGEPSIITLPPAAAPGMWAVKVKVGR